jgi:hypothetical protein
MCEYGTIFALTSVIAVNSNLIVLYLFTTVVANVFEQRALYLFGGSAEGLYIFSSKSISKTQAFIVYGVLAQLSLPAE